MDDHDDDQICYEDNTSVLVVTIRGIGLGSLYPETFRSLVELHELDISLNKLRSLDLDHFVSNKNLYLLNVTGNIIEYLFGVEEDTTLPNLRVLDISDNRIKHLDLNSFKMHGKLEHFIASRNRIKRLSGNLDEFNSLVSLSVDGNQINDLRAIRFLNFAYNNNNSFDMRDNAESILMKCDYSAESVFDYRIPSKARFSKSALILWIFMEKKESAAFPALCFFHFLKYVYKCKEYEPVFELYKSKCKGKI